MRLHLLHAALEKRAAALRAKGVLDAADLLVVDAVADRFGETDPEVLLGLALAVRGPRVGHVGVDLKTVERDVDAEHLVPQEVTESGRAWPEDVEAWERAVLDSPMVGDPSDVQRPFVRQPLGKTRTLVMSRRMWREQERLTAAAQALVASAPSPALARDAIDHGVRALFGEAGGQGAAAVRCAAARRLTVVTGGPGTGKTYSIKRLLALLLGVPRDEPLRVALAAPTGKAAVRMAEAIGEGLDEVPTSAEVRAALRGLQPRTLHKLLGVRPDGSCRHDADRPLPVDLVVVDEASMVDLALMRRLFEAIPDGARLVLLGDRDQLASVEAGTVLADVVGAVLDGERTDPASDALREAIVPFRTNHRFKSAPTIAAVASALQRRDDTQLAQVGRWMSGVDHAEGDPLPDRIVHLGAPVDGRPTEAQLDALAAPYLAGPATKAPGYLGLLADALRRHRHDAPAMRDEAFHLALLDALEGYRVLAVHRRGALGVSGLEQALVARAQAFLLEVRRPLHTRAGHWLGEPVLITENAYDVGLMNGDIGLVLPTDAGLAAIFPHHDGDSRGCRPVALARLPAHTSALSMTVHRSQGSQFARVAMVLAGRDSPIQTRELVYTAITRSSARLDWLGDPHELDRALRRRIRRASGLGHLLWGTAQPVPKKQLGFGF